MNKCAILDLDSIAYSIFNPKKVLDELKQPIKQEGKFLYEEKSLEEIVDSADFIMNKILTNCNCDSYIAFIKGFDTIYNKRLIDPNYKADRSKEQPKYWKFVKQYLIENWNAIEVNNIETDDACYITKCNIPNSFICAIDGDLLGLEGIHYCWRTKGDLTGRWITTSKQEAEYKFWCDMICGTHNNTKGIPKRGIKYCEKIFSGLFEDYRSIVFNEYITFYGEYLGIEEFYKNYKCLKILDKYEGFIIPQVTNYKRKETIEQTERLFE